ncbi:MAG TPA: SDR family oxidoreductase [Candidatus Angelobacter sp.]|nr:SDR family oxidoreductase [Candidatus Angelobacter sp.]
MKSGAEDGKVVVITGGGHGLGRAVAKRFAQERFRICILDIDAVAAQEVVKELHKQCYPAMFAQVDVADVNSIQWALEACVQRFSRIDILICSAAVAPVAHYLEVTPEDWDRAFAVNVRGLFFCNQRAARLMRKTGGGRIINITSPASYMGHAYYAAYAASKAAVDSITRSGAVALAEYNIRVNSLAPGRMDTKMQEATERKWAELAGLNYEQLVESRTQSLPLRRRTTPEEIAEAVLFLAVDASDYMTGSRLNISGGLELS